MYIITFLTNPKIVFSLGMGDAVTAAAIARLFHRKFTKKDEYIYV